MIMSEKSKQHVDSCRFCWMCHHICPIGNATGLERDTARARALGISLVNRGAVKPEEIIDNIYECALCGGCVNFCVTGWNPVMFTKEARLQAALDGILPPYIAKLLENCQNTGSAYGKKDLPGDLAAAVKAHAAKTDTLFFLGDDARNGGESAAAVSAVKVLEKTGEPFTVLADEPASGAQLDFLIGAAAETKEQMQKAAAVLNQYKTVIILDPADAKAVKQLYKEYGVEVKAAVKTFTAFAAEQLQAGRLAVKKTAETVTLHDAFELARDLEETEPARALVNAAADLKEMLLNRKETIFAGNLLMAQYLPDVTRKVAARRIFNARSIGVSTIVTESVGETAALKNAAEDGVKIVFIADLLK